jgi:tetratricopeptide (TPR) repeat protein
MARIKCKNCKKRVLQQAKNCPYCGAEIDNVQKPKKWHEKTSVTLCIAAFLILIGLGFIHIITGVVSPYRLPFDITLKKSFGYRETLINARKITSLPFVVAKTKYPIGCDVLQRLEYIQSGNVFETAMAEQLREAMNIWQTEFEETLNISPQSWQDQLKGQQESFDEDLSNAQTYNHRGINAALEGRYETAIAEFTRAFRKNPTYADACFNRGLVYVAIGQLGPAITDFSQTIEINPGFTEAYTHRGQLYIKMEQYDQAISDFTKILEMDQKVIEVHFKRALACFAKGRYDQAWDDVNKIRKMGLEIPRGFLINLRKASGEN